MNGKFPFRTKTGHERLLALPLFFILFPLQGQSPLPPGRDAAPAAHIQAAQPAPAAPAGRLQSGVSLYGRGMWAEALAELRRAYLEGANPSRKAEALYWIAMTEIAQGHYGESIQAMNELERLAPGDTRYAEVPYHRGRACYYLGRFDEAIVLFQTFIDSIAVDVPGENARRPAALYWMGECLFSLGQLDRAQDIFSLIVEQYPQSVKFEASSYRLALINQKKIETELLAILKWSHEESLRTVEEYQRRERSYDQAMLAYQRRIAGLLQDSRAARLETELAGLREQLEEAREEIVWLESILYGQGSNGTESSAPAGEAPVSGHGPENPPAAPVSQNIRQDGTAAGELRAPAARPEAVLPQDLAPPAPAPVRSPLHPLPAEGAAAPQAEAPVPQAGASQTAVSRAAASRPDQPESSAPPEMAAAAPAPGTVPAQDTQAARAESWTQAEYGVPSRARRLDGIRSSTQELITGLEAELQAGGR